MQYRQGTVFYRLFDVYFCSKLIELTRPQLRMFGSGLFTSKAMQRVAHGRRHGVALTLM